MFYQKFDILIFILISLVPVAFFTTYLIAVYNNHVEPGFPYISDTGTLPPESCIFGQFLAFGSFILFLVVYVRYHHVKQIINKDPKRLYLSKYNFITYLIGLSACCGISIVGNFQETSVISVHLIGAIFAFIGIFIYLTAQTFIAHKLSNILHSTKKMLTFRLILIVVGSTLAIICPVSVNLGFLKYKGENTLFWLPEDGGYVEHLISTSTEWIFSILLMVFLLTFVLDFRRIKIKYPTVIDCQLNDSTITEKF